MLHQWSFVKPWDPVHLVLLKTLDYFYWISRFVSCSSCWTINKQCCSLNVTEIHYWIPLDTTHWLVLLFWHKSYCLRNSSFMKTILLVFSMSKNSFDPVLQWPSSMILLKIEMHHDLSITQSWFCVCGGQWQTLYTTQRIRFMVLFFHSYK